MTNCDLDAEPIAELGLQLVFEYPTAISIAASTVRKDEKFFRRRIAPLSVILPPSRECLDGKRRSIVRGANKHMTTVALRFIKAPWNGRANRIPLEVMISNLNRLDFPRFPFVPEESEHLLLLCVNADDGPSL